MSAPLGWPLVNAAADPVGRVRAAYERIRQVDRPEVWITLRPEVDVIDDAAGVATRVAAGELLPLAGVLVAVKDNIDVATLPTTAACPEFAYLPMVSAPAVQRLIDAGAIVVGKTNLDQFATGLVGTRSPYGAVRCAWDPTLISGGSSSGSSVAVALGIVDVALGTDTAGSGRVPAGFHGLIGTKPTRGLVPTVGVVPACADYDVVTVFSHDVASASAVMSVMAGPLESDPRSRAFAPTAPLAAPETPRFAIPVAANLEVLSEPYRAAFDATVERLRRDEYDLVEVDLTPLLDAALLLYDGAIVAQRYAAVGEFLDTEPAGADPTVARIITAASGVRGADYVDDLERLATARTAALAMLAEVDALLIPTTTEHPTIAAVQADPVAINRRIGTFTNFCNLLDLAAVAFPGEPTAAGHPFGVTLVGPDCSDQVLLDLVAVLTGESTAPIAYGTDHIELAVFGAHLRGQPLNGQLESLGARFVEAVTTSDAYGLVALDTVPPKPGLVRRGTGAGAEIEGELWLVTPWALGLLLASLPAPMSLTSVDLADGRNVVGFGCAYDVVDGALDITDYGGWRAYLGANSTR